MTDRGPSQSSEEREDRDQGRHTEPGDRQPQPATNAAAGAIEPPLTGDYDEATADLAPLLVFNRSGRLPPLVLLRSWSIESRTHRRLARKLGSDQPLYSIGPPADVDPSRYPNDTAGFTAHFLGLLDRFGIQGPYLLGGWSFGGTIAVEVGKALARRGEEVRLVLLLDVRCPHPAFGSKPGSLGPISRWLLGLIKQPTPRARLTYAMRFMTRPLRSVGRKMKARSVERDPASMVDLIPEQLREQLPAGQELIKTHAGEMSALRRAVLVVAVRYQASKTRLSLAVLWTQQTRALSEGDATLRWGAHAWGDLQSFPVPGEHWTMLKEPNIDVVVLAIKSVLDRAQAKNSDELYTS